MKNLYMTKSVCPVCLREIFADITEREDGVYMEKTCPEHGHFSTLIWEDDADAYLRWLGYGGIDIFTLPQTEKQVERALGDLEFTCHACQQPASTALMTTNRCNMNCPVCFTRDKKEPLHEPDLKECRSLLTAYREKTGEDALLELCGGEPTVREDLCQLASMASGMGFDYIQLNTNGIRLAESVDYCRRLRESGITTVYLGFDGMTDKPYFAKYGRSLLETKKQAVKNCGEAGLAVVLVACVIPGENDAELGKIVEYAKENMPAVKGVYLQPISYFGIYPEDKIRRITIPAVLRALCSQCEDISPEDFNPASYDHPQCSFNAAYMLGKDGKLWPVSRLTLHHDKEEAVHRLRKNIRMTWMPSPAKMLTIGGMAFQDSWNIDLQRIRRCSVQIIQKDGELIPLCSKYLSGCDGSKLFPGIG